MPFPCLAFLFDKNTEESDAGLLLTGSTLDSNLYIVWNRPIAEYHVFSFGDI